MISQRKLSQLPSLHAFRLIPFLSLSHVARGRLRRCANFQRSLDRLSRLRACQTDILTWAVMQSFSPKSATPGEQAKRLE